MNLNNKYLRLHVALILSLFAAGLTGPLRPAAAAPVTPSATATAAPSLPDFTLTSTDGRPCRLAEYHGRPVALFFFCGCPWCRECAETWGKFQHGGALPPSTTQTLVVFSGNAAEASRFAAETGLDLAQTTLLPDPDLQVTTAAHADPCPRAFVLDPAGTTVYTNSHPADAPRHASALVIASRTLDALRAAAAPPAPAPDTPRASLPALTLSGQRLDFAGKPGWKVLYFWSSTCPCVRDCERYSFRPLAAKYSGQVAFYAITSGRYDLDRSRHALLRDIAARHLPYPVVLDPGGHLAVALGAQVTPQTFLINPQGHVVFSGMPDDSRLRPDAAKTGITKPYLARALSQALAGKLVTVPIVKDLGCLIGY